MRKLTELDFSASRREVWLIVDAVLAEMERPGEELVAFVAAQYSPPTNFHVIVRQDIKTIVRAIREGK